MNGDPKLLRGVLHRAAARYLTVGSKGLQLGERPAPTATARILAWGAARTLYEQGRPVCRSLDGVVSVSHAGRTCDGCTFAPRCTGQIRVDLLIAGRPWRLMLAFTSAKNFLVYEASLQGQRVRIEDIDHRIAVVDRGRFGELRFSRAT
jgi:hypothetical protein